MNTGEYLKSLDYVCPYCNKKYEGIAGIMQHIRFEHNKTAQDVYDEFCKEEGDGICLVCGKPTEYKCGHYLKTCSKECKDKLISIKKIGKSIKRKYNTESYIEEAQKIHGDKFDYSQTEYNGIHNEITVICKKHGLFTTMANYHLLNKCGGCRKCANESISKTRNEWDEEKKKSVSGKRCQTNLERFNNTCGPLPFGSKEYKQKILEKYGVENPFQAEEIKEKIKETNLRKYGVENPGQTDYVINASHSEEANRKRYLTHKKNNSFNASQPEEDFYDFLLELCDKKDVFRNYKDDNRYPFACDFYIKSQDVFIELNLYFTHGFHWFDENDPEDMKKVKEWKDNSDGNNLYAQALKVWTKSDVLKRQYAQKNNLKYIVFWNVKEIKEFKLNVRKKEELFERINNILESDRSH